MEREQRIETVEAQMGDGRDRSSCPLAVVSGLGSESISFCLSLFRPLSCIRLALEKTIPDFIIIHLLCGRYWRYRTTL